MLKNDKTRYGRLEEAMNIKIDNITDKKKYLDESMYISLYICKIMKNRNKKIKLYTRKLLETIILSIMIIAFLIFIYVSSEYVRVSCICLIAIYTYIFLLYLIKLIKTHKFLKRRCQEKTNSIIKISDKKIVLKNSNIGMSVEQDWKDICFIKESKYCIIFINNQENQLKPYIGIPIEYKSELMKAIEKYNIEIPIIQTKK